MIMNESSHKNNHKIIISEFKKCLICPICLDYFNIPISLKCNHTFCKECLESAMVVNEQCPICKTKVLRNKITWDLQIENIDSIINQSKKLIESICPDDDSKSITYKPILKHLKSIPANKSHSSTDQADISNNSVASIARTEIVPDIPKVIFEIDEVVEVLPRCWPGINKPGGAAWIKKIDNENDSYDVRYIVSNQNDFAVPSMFITKAPIFDRSHRRSKISHDKHSTSSSSSSHVNGEIQNSVHEYNSKSKKKIPFIRENKPIFLLASSVQSEIYEVLEIFGKSFDNITISNRFEENVTTHLVVHLDENNILKNRTMKYMLAIMSGIWIVSYKWIEDSLEKCTIQDETLYEVKYHSKAKLSDGPKRAREAMYKIQKGLLPKLFSNVRIFLFGSFPLPGPPKSDIQQLLEIGGCNIVTSIQDLSPLDSSSTNAVICANRESKVELVQKLQDQNINVQEIHIINPMWVLDCITNHNIEDISSPHYID